MRRQYKKKYTNNQVSRIKYKKKKFQNPFFRGKKKFEFNLNFLFSNKGFFYGIMIVLFIIVISWFFCYSSYFQIKNITVNGEGKINPADIEKITKRQLDKTLYFIMPQSSLTLMNKQKLIERFELKYKFDYVKIEKDFPNSLIISYKEKQHFITWFEDEVYYKIDENGGIISEVSLLDLNNSQIPLVKNLSDSKIDNGDIFVSPDNLKYAKNLFENLKKYREELEIEYYYFDNEKNLIKAKIVNGPEIIFNTEKDQINQIDKLIILKNNKLKEDFYNKSYINLSVGDSIYYR